MILKYLLNFLTFEVQFTTSMIEPSRKVFRLNSTDNRTAEYYPHPIHYANRTIRQEIADMLWHRSTITVGLSALEKRSLPLALTSRIQHLSIDMEEYSTVLQDVSQPFINELHATITPAQVEVTGYGNLRTVHLGCAAWVRGGEAEVEESQRLVRLIYFKKPFELEITVPIYDEEKDHTHQTTVRYSSQSGIKHEGRPADENTMQLAQDVFEQLCLAHGSDQMIDDLQVEREDDHQVVKEDFADVKRVISKDRLEAFAEAWKLYFPEEE